MPGHGSAERQNRAADIYNLKRTSDDQQKRDNIRRFQNSLVHHNRNLQKADRIGSGRCIASRLDQFSSGRFVRIPHKLACRHKISGGNRQNNQTHNDYQRVRCGEFFASSHPSSCSSSFSSTRSEADTNAFHFRRISQFNNYTILCIFFNCYNIRQLKFAEQFRQLNRSAMGRMPAGTMFSHILCSKCTGLAEL